jgi:hypothetical protein
MFADGAAEQVLDVPVDAAKLVRRPSGELLPELGLDAQQERLLDRHRGSFPAALSA